MANTRRGWLRILFTDGIILFVWLAALSSVALEGAGFGWLGVPNSLKSLKAPLKVQEQWFGISYLGEEVGTTHMSVFPTEYDGIPGITILDSGKLMLNLMGNSEKLIVGTRAFIDSDWKMRRFSAQVRSDAMRLTWSGHREGEQLVITAATPLSSVTKRFSDRRGGAFVNGLSSWTAFRHLHVGDSGQWWMLNPLALNPEAVFYSVPRSEEVDGQTALVVETDVSGMKVTSWVTPEGKVLKEASPLGWELRGISENEARSISITGAMPSADLLSTSAVSIDRALNNPKTIQELVLLLDGINASSIEIKRHVQKILPESELAGYQVEAPDGPFCILRLTRAKPPGEAPKDVPESIARYRKPSPFVQSDDWRIRERAIKIVGSSVDRWEQVVKLNDWVFSTIRKQLTVGLPSAVDVLAMPVGDCHEHTVLFTALARSLGIPTRMVAGLVYWRDRLYYHAWPEVWIGEWIPTDPTLGQKVADAAHIALVEAENERLLMLGQFIGKLHVKVLSVERSEPVSGTLR